MYLGPRRSTLAVGALFRRGHFRGQVHSCPLHLHISSSVPSLPSLHDFALPSISAIIVIAVYIGDPPFPHPNNYFPSPRSHLLAIFPRPRPCYTKSIHLQDEAKLVSAPCLYFFAEIIFFRPHTVLFSALFFPPRSLAPSTKLHRAKGRSQGEPATRAFVRAWLDLVRRNKSHPGPLRPAPTSPPTPFRSRFHSTAHIHHNLIPTAPICVVSEGFYCINSPF